jgi:hypothetical protein
MGSGGPGKVVIAAAHGAYPHLWRTRHARTPSRGGNGEQLWRTLAFCDRRVVAKRQSSAKETRADGR